MLRMVLGASMAVVGAVGTARGAVPADGGAHGNLGGGVDGPGSFVHWENHPIRGLEITPDGTRLLLTNTPDNRLEVFDITGAVPVLVGHVQVGLDPVAVKAFSSTQAWVVNHISDSVSVVDLPTMRVIDTIATADEPFDIVFAGTNRRAFVSCSQANKVLVIDPAARQAPALVVDINGEDPRGLAVSPDGRTVYAAICESGNATTILGGGSSGLGTVGFPPNVVNHASGPWGGVNPPPNAPGNTFEPPMAPGNPAPPKVGMIVRKTPQGQWMDDNGGNWTNLVSGPQAGLSGRVVGWDLPDRDLAVIDATSLVTTYTRGMMNLCMNLSVNPVSGRVTVIGTDGTNEKRFEPNVNGVFLRVVMAQVAASGSGPVAIKDLNPHLNYQDRTIPPSERVKSIGDPRSVVWNSTGSRGYICGMGSNNVIVVDGAGNRAGIAPTIPVGEGPVSLALDESRGRLYVYNRFEGSVSVVSTATEVEVARIPLHDPSPTAVKAGRKHLYDTHKNSGLGHLACASCHFDARMDRLAWDLGDPTGAVKSLAGINQGAGIVGLEPNTTNPPFAPFHPMKGPMTTQTLVGAVGLEPLHWRGDRLGLEEFNGAFVGLQAADSQLTAQEMQEFEDFLATIHFPPNPFRNFDNTLPATLPLPGHFTSGRFGAPGQPLPAGRPNTGLTRYRTGRIDGGVFNCVTCHTLPTGAGPDMVFSGGQFRPIAPGPNGERHIQCVSVDGSTNVTIKTPHLRNAYEKVGFEMSRTESNAGFGFLHDGSVDSLSRFVGEPVFNVLNEQDVADLVAFVMCISGSELPAGSPTNILEPPGPPSKDSPAAVGRQTTVLGQPVPPAQATLITQMQTLAGQGKVGLVVKGRVNGVPRGYVFRPGGTYQSDRAAETLSAAQLLALAAAGQELTYTVVQAGTQTRIGIDRDGDAHFDRDEFFGCADPADPASYPGAPGNPDCDQSTGQRTLDIFDFLCFQNAYSALQPYACDCDTSTGPNSCDIFDFLCFQNAFDRGCP